MERKRQKKTLTRILIFLEVILFFVLFSFFPKIIFAGIGVNNVTVITNLTVGNVFPEILNVSIEDNSPSFVLTPNATTKLQCKAVIRDFNGELDLRVVNATFFDNFSSSYGDINDNNFHYTNSSCNILYNFGSFLGYTDDEYTALANCTFDVWYYANSTDWNCTIIINDSYNWKARDYDMIGISPLLALGLPDIIQYGTVNATYVSDENITNVTNFGNVKVNLSLSGYGFRENDGNAMNCTLGSIKNISIYHEKYNLSKSTPGDLTLTQFQTNYINLTSYPIVRQYNLDFRHNDISNEAWNYTYWRIYVPIGVAGTCQGNIIFGAVQANEI